MEKFFKLILVLENKATNKLLVMIILLLVVEPSERLKMLEELTK